MVAMNTIRKKIVALLVGFLITTAILAFSWQQNFNFFSLLPHLNNFLYDANLKLFHKPYKKTRVIIVDIDEESLAAEGKWPWPRNKLAALIDKLYADRAAVIAFDILFPEKDVNPAKIILNYAKHKKNAPEELAQYLNEEQIHLDNDKIFAKALLQGDSVLGVFFHNDLYDSVGYLGSRSAFKFPDIQRLVVPQLKHYTAPIESLMQSAKHIGFVTSIPDDDGILRRTPLLIKNNGKLYPSLPLEAVRLYMLQDKVELVTEKIGHYRVMLGIKLGNIYIPTDPAGNILIPFKGQAFTFPYVSAVKVLRNQLTPDVFVGKIVLIGSSAVGIGDMQNTPLQSASFPGVEVHANVIASIINKDFIVSPVWAIGLERILIVILGCILSVVLLYCSAAMLFLTIIGAELGLFLLQFLAWVKWNLILPHPVLLYLLILLLGLFNLGYAYIFEIRFRYKLRDLYGQYVSNKHLDAMLDDPNRYTQGGESKEMSVLFTDIRSFTSIAEKLSAKEVKIFLNQLFTPLTEIIFNSKGTIDKYVGDMIMAFWNDPIDDKHHCQNAVLAGLNMLIKVQELAPIFAEQKLPEVKIGVGVNSGVMHVGDMGSKFRRSYTVLGDAVNLASRLESSTKFYGVKMLVAEITKKHCPDISFQFVDKVKMKGKDEAINIYEPICLSKNLAPNFAIELQEHEKALQAYFKQDWSEAKSLFIKLFEQNSKLLYKLFLERIEVYIVSPPPKDWDGSFKRSQK